MYIFEQRAVEYTVPSGGVRLNRGGGISGAALFMTLVSSPAPLSKNLSLFL